jgi:hypothetical protein
VRCRVAFACALASVAFLVPSEASAGKSCKEVSDIVGEQECTRYGNGWAVERKWPLTLRFGLRYGELSTSGLSFKEGFKSKDRPKGYTGYRLSGEALGVSTLSGVGFDSGFTFFVAGQLYLGMEGAILFGSTKTAAHTTGSHSLSDAGGVDVFMVHGGVPIGYRIPLGRASIRGEVLFGGILASVTQRDLYDGESERKSASSGRGLIEPRIAADIWFTQHVSFGAYAGVNMLDGGRAMGLSLTWHHRAFDGDMSIW